MKFSLNSQGNNINGTATNGNKSEMNEEIEMKYANTNIRMNTGNSGSLVIKNTLKLAAGLALAGMIAMTATLGSVLADSPLKTNSFLATGPNEMEPEYLNRLGARTFIAHGPNEMEPEYLNRLGAGTFIAHGPNEMEPEYLNNLGNSFFVHGPDVVEQSSISTYFVHGPDVVEQSIASAYIVHGPDTSEWNG